MEYKCSENPNDTICAYNQFAENGAVKRVIIQVDNISIDGIEDFPVWLKPEDAIKLANEILELAGPSKDEQIAALKEELARITREIKCPNCGSSSLSDGDEFSGYDYLCDDCNTLFDGSAE